jgi:hypothetical protein
MSGIDYSKWDKMSFSDEDSTSSCEKSAPRVTRLDEPSRVTFSSKGATVEAASKTSKTEVSTTHKKEKKKSSGLKRMTKNGAFYVDPVTRNKVFWSQDRDEVILRICYDQSIASRDIRVNILGALKYEDRHSAVGSPEAGAMCGGKRRLTVSAIGRDAPLLEGDLDYNVHFAEDEGALDWEIDVTDPSRKVIQVTFLKAVPMQGLTVWWSRPLSHFPDIDVASGIDGRNKHEQLKQSWEEAHQLFRDKIKKGERNKVMI